MDYNPQNLKLSVPTANPLMIHRHKILIHRVFFSLTGNGGQLGLQGRSGRHQGVQGEGKTEVVPHRRKSSLKIATKLISTFTSQMAFA